MNDDGSSGTLCTSGETNPRTGRPYFCLQSGERGDKFSYVCKQTGQMRDDFQTVLDWGPDTIVLLGGTNDLNYRARGIDSIKSNLRDMLDRANAQGIRTVSVTPMPIYDSAGRRARAESGDVDGEEGEANVLANMHSLREWILSSDNPADLKVDLYPHFAAPGTTDDYNPELYGNDKIHPNPQGKQLQAQKIHAVLTGAEPSAGPAGPSTTDTSGTATPSSTGGTATPSQVMCVPESVLPRMLYDFIINSTMGKTTIVGIARQNIAVGINKTRRELPSTAVCQPLTADREYDIDFLKSTYGRTQQEVESQLEEIRFMSSEGRENDIRVHRLIVPAFQCVEQEIERCISDEPYDFRTIDSYEWQGLAEDPELLSTSSFGISVNINLDTNPAGQPANGSLAKDVPDCVVQAFQRFGFRWGGESTTVRNPAHFEFMTDPVRIAVLTEFACPDGMTLAVGPGGTRYCQPQGSAEVAQSIGVDLSDVPIAADENGEAKRRIAQAIDAIGRYLPYDKSPGHAKHPTCCGDWAAMVYRWAGYAYQYGDSGPYNSVQELANRHGYPVAYNDNRGSAGHALILLGFGPESEWWLEQFPDIPLTAKSAPRSVNERQALIISYLGSKSQKVKFSIYPRNRYPASIKTRKVDPPAPAQIIRVHPLTPLCDGDYVAYPQNKRYSDDYAGTMYWTNDQAGGQRNPWSRFWEPDSPFYPRGQEQCTAGGSSTATA